MKKIIAIACVAWMALTGIYAGNISVEDVQMQAGDTKTVSISLTNTETNLVGFQMDLTLPEGISINKAGCSLSSRFGDPDQVLTIGKQGDNVYRLTSTSLALTPINGTSGTLLMLSLTAFESAQGGTATLSNIRFATSNSGRVTMSNTSFNIIGKTEQTLSLESLPEMTYGDAAYTLPATTEEGLTLTWTSDNAAVASISGNTLTVGNAGTATITATQAGNNKYLPFSREFSLTVDKAALTITANDCSKMEGEENPELTVSYEGFVNGDTEAVLTQQPAVTTTATEDSPAGTYPITASGAQSANYEISYVAGTMTVEDRCITFADDKVKAICVQKWDTNGDGKLNFDEAAAVTNLGTVFKQKATITSFDELQYFTGLTSIWGEAFYGCSGLTSVNIPNSVTSIGYEAFYNCRGLTSITIPNSVTSIGNDAFSGCSSLTAITIPNSVTNIGSEAFYECGGLTSVTIGNSVTSIGDRAFYDCSGLTSVTIPNSVTSIGGYAFSGCSGLTSVTIPNSVVSIGSRAFWVCSGLTSIKVESGNTKYDSRNNSNALIETNTNTLIAGCKNTVIPNSVTSIGALAFYACRGLTEITIPSSVTSIGDAAFDSCSGLTSVTIPNSVTSIGRSAFYECGGLTEVTIGNSVTSIGYEAFYNCTGLTSVTIPNSVTSIGGSAFQFCNGLTSVTIPNSVTSIGYDAFDSCSGLTSVKVGMETPLSISSSTFSNRANAILYVPRGSKAAYEAADYWKEFKEIVEYGGIEQTLALETLPSMTYGDDAYTLPETTAEGLTLTWNSDNTAVATVSGNVLAINGAGTATITATQAGNDSYLPFSREFSLTVGKAALTITANDCTKVEGEENPELTVSYEGFKYEDEASVLTQQPSVITEATTDSPAGTYPITVSGAEAANYDISYVAGTLTVEDASLEPTDISQIDNVIYMEPQEVRTGSLATLSFKMKNDAPIRGFQFDLYLPEGMTVATFSNGKVQASLDATKLPEGDDHQLTTSIQPDGAVRFLCNSQYDENFATGDDIMMTLKVNVSEDMTEGEYPVDLKTVKLSETDISKYYLTELVRSKVTVGSYLLGDVNADGVVDISDYISMANYIHGNVAEGFVFRAGDIDGNGSIDISDYIGVSNIIHTGSPSGNSQAGAKAALFPSGESQEKDPE